MDALTAKVREALIAEGASPATALLLATAFVERANDAIERDRLERKAQLLLALGPNIAAERLGVCRATVYNLAHRARRKSKENATA